MVLTIVPYGSYCESSGSSSSSSSTTSGSGSSSTSTSIKRGHNDNCFL